MTPHRALAALLTALAISGCAAARQLPAPVMVDHPSAVPAGVKPLTVEQEEDSAAMLPKGRRS